MPTRAERRYKRQVKRRKIKQFIKNCWYGGQKITKLELEEFSNYYSRKMLNHPAKCSCEMCGNPRKWFKEKSLKEKISELKLKETLIDLGEFFLAKKHNYKI